MLDGPYAIPLARHPVASSARASRAEVMSWLVQRWALIAGISCGGAALAYAGSLLIPPSFVATTTLFVDSRSVQPLANPSGQTQGGDNNLEVSFVESQAKIITSRSVLSRVVAAQGLTDDPAFNDAARTPIAEAVRSFLGVAPAEAPSPEMHRLRTIAALADRVTVRRPERTFVIDVSARARTAEMAARLANAVAQAYFDEQASARATKARRGNDALTNRLDELRSRVQQAQARAQAFEQQHGLIGTRLQLSSEQQLTEANAQLAQARLQRVQRRAQLDNLARQEGGAKPDGNTPEALASPTITQLRGKQADAQRQVDTVLGQFGPRHPAVRDAKDQLASTEQMLQVELNRIRQAAQVEYNRAVDAEKTAQAIVNRLSRQAASTSGALAQAMQLQQEVEINKNLLNTFLSRSREIGEFGEIDTSAVRVISVAEPPLHRAFPPRGILFAAAGAFLGFWIAIAGVVLRRARFPSMATRQPSPAGETTSPSGERGRDFVS